MMCIRPITLVASAAFCCMLQACKSKPTDNSSEIKSNQAENATAATAVVPVLDTAAYRQHLARMANGDTTGRWPAPGDVLPKPGALLPANRIVAFYGNMFSKRMGILGEIPKADMLQKLLGEAAAWQAADSTTKVIPALHYVAVTAQGAPGKDGKHRLRMPFAQIDTIVQWTSEIKGISFVDVQVGHSTVQEEIPALEKYLQMPTMHLGIDPEFSMKGGERPGSKIGTFDAADINFTIDYLAQLVDKYNLPPKILIVHRFTRNGVTNYKAIKRVPQVQVVIDMDGFGDKPLKLSTYKSYVVSEPVQFTGFKLFYKNDTKENKNGLFSPAELIQLVPRPMYIQYQ